MNFKDYYIKEANENIIIYSEDIKDFEIIEKEKAIDLLKQYRIGGKYKARMEAKDGSFGFDFEATYTEIKEPNNFSYEFGGRFATMEFKELQKQTEVIVTFDPESENSVDLQRQGWQAILDNFKKYTEAN
jgi:uncharacterized protein YndB with AHSA1/START domain